MTYRLFIDDERFPVDWTDVVIARNSFDAMQFVMHRGLPCEIMFDHDLGGPDTVRTFIRYFIEHLIDNSLALPPNFKYSVHSQNPVGKEWIEAIMQQVVYEFGTDK